MKYAHNDQSRKDASECGTLLARKAVGRHALLEIKTSPRSIRNRDRRVGSFPRCASLTHSGTKKTSKRGGVRGKSNQRWSEKSSLRPHIPRAVTA